MFTDDIKVVFRISVLVIIVTISTRDVILNIPPPHSLLTVLVGRSLFWIALGPLALLRSEERPMPRLPLVPQTQLALWALGVTGAILATDRLGWLYPHWLIWSMLLILHTFAYREGLRWLLRGRVVPR